MFGENDEFPMREWRFLQVNGATQLSYWSWVACKIELKRMAV